MDSQRQSHLFDLMLAGAVTISVPIVVFVIWPMVAHRFVTSPQGASLVCEVDRTSLPKGAAVDMELLTSAVDRLVNPQSQRTANVQLREDGRIEVALIRHDDDETRDVKQKLSDSAVLEFRFLASHRHDKALIDRAESSPSQLQVLGEDGSLLAWWAPVTDRLKDIVANNPEIVQRTSNRGNREVLEVLVVSDAENLNGVYLLRVDTDVDTRGHVRLGLNFSSKGGQLFHKLTSSRLSKDATDRSDYLGVILDGRLLAVPRIVSVIRARAEIDVPMSKQKADALASRLNAGCLPVRIRLVADPQ